MNIYPYVYRLDHPGTGEFYIGYRESNKLPAQLDLGHKYFTSSTTIRKRFEEFDYQIIAEFFDPDDAYDFEQELIFDEWNNPLILNKHCTHGKDRWRLTDLGRRKLSESKKGKNNPNFKKIYSEEEKIKQSNRMKENNPFKGKKHSKESLQLMSDIRKKHIAENGNSMSGRSHSDETKRKQSELLKARPKCCRLSDKKEMYAFRL